MDLVPELETLKAEIQEFATEYCEALPADAGAALKRFLGARGLGVRPRGRPISKPSCPSKFSVPSSSISSVIGNWRHER